MTRAERIERVERETKTLPVAHQCRLLDVPRSSVYCPRAPQVSADDLTLMKRLDEIHLEHAFLGSRRLCDRFEQGGDIVNRKRIQRLMRIMGLTTLYPKRKTSLRNPAHKVYPYLLRGLTIDRPNQVWCTDISVPQQAA